MFASSTGVGVYNLSNGGVLSVGGAERIGRNNGGNGTFNQSGGTHTVTGDVTIAFDAGSTGTFNLSGGSLEAANMIVNNGGTLNYSGGSLSLGGGAGTLTNNVGGKVNLTGVGTRTVDANVVNDGTFHVSNTIAEYTGTFTNNGAYISDPSTSIYDGDLLVLTDGYLTGGSGDLFVINAAFFNSSTQNILWSTGQSSLEFDDGTHDLSLAGLDLGAVFAGYGDNFAWGTFELDSGAGLLVTDGNGANASTALYAGVFLLADGIGQLSSISSDYNIYYDPNLAGNAYLNDLTYAFGSGTGHLIPIGEAPPPVPEPATILLLLIGLLLLEMHRRRVVRIRA